MRLILRTIGRFLREADIFLLIISIISSIYGIVLIASSRHIDSHSEVYVQFGALAIGLVLFILFTYIDIDIIADKYGFLFVFSILFLLTLQFWGYGTEEVGNRAWLRFFGIGIQPAEVVKVIFIIIIGRMVANYKERKTLNSIISIFQVMVVFFVLFGMILIVSADLGSAIVYFFILVMMLFIGGLKLRWFVLGGAIIAAASPLLWMNFLTQRQKDRILGPLFPDMLSEEALDTVMWQATRSVNAITSGGFKGVGLGNGRYTQRALIPHQHNDFVFSIAGEELGFIGCMAIIILLLVIIIRCIYVGIKSNNSLGMLVCVGIAAMFIVQTIENIGMCLAILPVVGITLPFFSYGGSSLVTAFAAMGIVSGIKMRPKSARFRTL